MTGSKAVIVAGKQNKTKQNFSNYTQLICRFHVKYNIQTKIKKKYFLEINNDLKKINSGIKMLEIASTNL